MRRMHRNLDVQAIEMEHQVWSDGTNDSEWKLSITKQYKEDLQRQQDILMGHNNG